MFKNRTLLITGGTGSFGNAVLNAWIAGQGKSTADITPIQRLKYTGKRGMGALTYHPATVE